MNRPIKFRGKRIDNGDWVYGDLLNEYWISGNTFLKTAIRYKIGDYYSFPIEVDPTTVGQLTGLKDRNGKEIYEGDVVKINHWKSSDLFDYSKPFLVKWQSGQINFKQGEYNNFIGSLVGKLEFEVIGNIHENPELL